MVIGLFCTMMMRTVVIAIVVDDDYDDYGDGSGNAGCLW